MEVMSKGRYEPFELPKTIGYAMSRRSLVLCLRGEQSQIFLLRFIQYHPNRNMT